MRLAIFSLLLVLFLSPSSRAQTERSISEIRDGVYRVSSGSYHGVVWDTPQGLVVIDPINPETAEWLKRELKRRFDKPVRYLIYSHNHPDHSLGGEVFDAPQTITVSHRYAAEDMDWSRLPTRLPELTFEDELHLQLGQQTLTLRYHGPNNGRGSVSFHFKSQRILFVVDWVVVGRMPYRDLPGYDIHGMIRSTREILNLDWDLFVGGHADMGSKKEVRRYLKYLETLYAAVRDGMLAGKSPDQLKEEIRLPEFRGLKMFEEWRVLNIEGVYRTLEDDSYILNR